MATIGGLGIPWNVQSDIGGFLESWSPDVFSAQERSGGFADVLSMSEHDFPTLGRVSAGTLRLFPRPDGMHFELDVPSFSGVAEQVARGDVRGASWTFQVPDGGDVWGLNADGVPTRHVTNAHLAEVGPVTRPAFPQTSIRVISSGSGRQAEDAAAEQIRRRTQRCVLAGYDELETAGGLSSTTLAEIAAISRDIRSLCEGRSVQTALDTYTMNNPDAPTPRLTDVDMTEMLYGIRDLVDDMNTRRERDPEQTMAERMELVFRLLGQKSPLQRKLDRLPSPSLGGPMPVIDAPVRRELPPARPVRALPPPRRELTYAEARRQVDRIVREQNELEHNHRERQLRERVLQDRLDRVQFETVAA